MSNHDLAISTFIISLLVNLAKVINLLIFLKETILCFIHPLDFFHVFVSVLFISALSLIISGYLLLLSMTSFCSGMFLCVFKLLL